MVPVSMTFSDHLPRFQGHGVTIDALNVLCAQLTHDLLAIAKFFFIPLAFHAPVRGGTCRRYAPKRLHISSPDDFDL